MNVMSSGTHRFRCFAPVVPSRVWIALTDGQETGKYLHGLVADSSWCAGAPIHFRAAPLQPESQSTLAGRVLRAQTHRRLSYFLRSGPKDPSTYLTWQIRSCPGGSHPNPTQPRSRLAERKAIQTLAHAARVMAPALVALTFASVAHAQGTMDFSGATTLMGAFKTFAIYAGAVICFGGLIFAGIRMMSGRFQDAIPGLFGALFGAGILGWGAGWIGSLTGQTMQ